MVPKDSSFGIGGGASSISRANRFGCSDDGVDCSVKSGGVNSCTARRDSSSGICCGFSGEAELTLLVSGVLDDASMLDPVSVQLVLPSLT